MPMQVVEMGVSDQNDIDRRQVSHVQTRLPDAFEQKQPAREVRVDDDALPPKLQKETGVSNEGDAKFSVGYKPWTVGSSGARRDGGVTHEPGKLTGPFPQRRIIERSLD